MSVYSELVSRLSSSHIDSPRLEARLILSAVLACDENDSRILSCELDDLQHQKLEDMILRRLAHCPLDKILGHKEFYKYDFIVNQDVLSPRPDTEILVEAALQEMKSQQGSILDLGTGSGCIILSLLAEKSEWYGVGVDVSAKALTIAEKNAEKLGVESRIRWINKNWFEDDFIEVINDKFDVIVSNPPYIPDADIALLDMEVKSYDPMSALSGGQDGFDSYKKIAKLVPFLLKENGYIFLEAGIGQAGQIAEIFAAVGLKKVNIIKDLSGIERCVILKK